MPHIWGGSDADPVPTTPPFLLPIFGPDIAPTVFVGIAFAVAAAAVAIEVAFAIVVATPFSLSFRSVIFVLNRVHTHATGSRAHGDNGDTEWDYRRCEPIILSLGCYDDMLVVQAKQNGRDHNGDEHSPERDGESGADRNGSGQERSTFRFLLFPQGGRIYRTRRYR